LLHFHLYTSEKQTRTLICNSFSRRHAQEIRGWWSMFNSKHL